MNFSTITIPDIVINHLDLMFKSIDKSFEEEGGIGCISFEERVQSPVSNFLITKIEELGIRVGTNMITEYYYFIVEDDQYAPFDWHKDSAVLSNCYTAVLYYDKSSSIKGGNLYYKQNGKKLKCNIKASKERGIAQLALFDGDLEHYVTAMKGKGVRQSVSFFIEKR